MVVVVSIVAVVASLSATTAVLAAYAATPPDIVRTKDGGMMRGTIIESIPNERVDIMLSNGESRTIPMTDVVYAGTASADPGAAPPVTARPPPARKTASRPATIRLELKTDQAGLTFHRKLGTSQGYASGGFGGGTEVVTTHLEQVCSAPCAVELPRGSYEFGLSLEGSRVLETGTEFELNGDTRLHGRVESRTGIRVAGWLTIAASIVVGAVVAVYDRQRECDAADICRDRYPYMAPGIIIIAGGGALGAYMALQSDRARIDIR